MKSLIYIIISAFFASAALIGCGGNRYGEARLKAADAVMTAAPDSALRILAEINPDSLGERQRAWYSLLLTKANDKNHQPIEKSLIEQAAEFYEGKGDSLEAQSLYYLGYYYSKTNVLDTALVILSRAHETALNSHDMFYAAMSARELASVYRRQFILDQALNWGKTAKTMFIDADRPRHAAWIDLSLANYLLVSGLNDSAKTVLDTAEQSVYYSDEYFRYIVILNRIELALKKDDYKGMWPLFDSLTNDGYRYLAHDRLNQTNAALAEGMYDDAEKYLEMAQRLGMSEADSLYLGKMRSKLFAAKKEYKQAYESAMEFADDVIRSDSLRLTKPQTLLLTDNYKLKTENHKLQIERDRQWILCLMGACLVLGMLILLMRKSYLTKLASRQLEIDRQMAASQTLQEDLALSDSRFQEMSERHTALRQSAATRESDLTKEVRGLFSRHLGMLNEICDIWFNNTEKSASSNRLYKQINTMLSNMRTDAFVEELSDIINSHDDNWVSRLREVYPNLTEAEYQLAIYLHLGFRPSTIVVLTDRSTMQAVYTAKHKLKKKMVECAPTPDDSILRELFFEVDSRGKDGR